MKGIETVILEKHHFDKRDESFLVTTFLKLWTTMILMQGLISMVFQPIPPLQE